MAITIDPKVIAIYDMTDDEVGVVSHLLGGKHMAEDRHMQEIALVAYRTGRRDLQRTVRGILGVK